MRNLLLLPLLLVASALLVAGSPAHAQGTGGAPTKLRSGSLEGRWDLPDPTGPGSFQGHLLTRRGEPLFRVAGVVLRDRTPQTTGAPGDGKFVGRAVLLVGPRAGAEFDVRGRWEARLPGRGTFHGAILAPTPPRGNGGSRPEPLLRLDGRFRDPDPLRPNGRFSGRWIEPR